VEADAEAESVLPSRRSSFAECVKALRGPADLHNHTTASDGDMDPAELVRAAAQAGVAALAVTDHDTVAGVREAMIAGESAGVLVIPGVELSCTNPNYADSGKREIHLVGLFIDWRDPELVGRLESLAAERIERARGIARKLDQVGVNIDAEAVIRSAQGVVGRMHIADALLDAGAVATRPQAFDRYIGEEAPAYLPKRFLSTREAIGIIHAAGGVAILAHPALSRADALIPGMVEEGLDGLEVYCPVHSPWEAMHYAELCRNHGLLASGGSDSHGTRKPDSPVGHTTVEAELVVKLFERSLLYGAGSAQRLNT